MNLIFYGWRKDKKIRLMRQTYQLFDLSQINIRFSNNRKPVKNKRDCPWDSLLIWYNER